MILVQVSLIFLFSHGHFARDCGKPLSLTKQGQTEGRIVSGYDVGYYKYPWYTALMQKNIIACGGALIGPKVVITAAHCFKSFLKSNTTKLETVYTVLLGVYNKCEKEATQKYFAVEKVHVHEKYEQFAPYYDIAMLLLKEDTNKYRSICLPRTVLKVRPKEGTVPGLGTMKYHGPTPCTLQEARLLIYSDDACRLMINRTGNDPSKLFGAFCAGYLQGGIDTCQGDSGGPLQIQDDEGNYILMGIVSFGFHCANPGFLGVYTDASQYLHWIQEKSGLKSSDNASESDTTTVIGTTTPKFTESSSSVTTPTILPTPTTPTTTNKQIIYPQIGGMDLGAVPAPYQFGLVPYYYVRPIRIIIMDKNNKATSSLKNKLKRNRNRKKPTER